MNRIIEAFTRAHDQVTAIDDIIILLVLLPVIVAILVIIFWFMIKFDQ